MTIPNSAFSITVDSNGNLGFYNLSSGSEIAYLTPSGQFNSDSYNLSAGSGISLSGNTIENTGVLSLQGSTGALSLVAGTGIDVSGLTITNTGIISLSAGDGISVSGSTIEMSGSYSGNMAISGQLTAQYINANINNDNPNGSTPTVVLSIWGGGQGNAVSSTESYYGLGISDSTLDFISNGGFAWWYNDTEIASMNSSGDMSIAGYLSVTGEISGGSYNLSGGTGISFSGTTITNTGVTSLTAGTGITLSGSTGDVTVTNSGVTSVQGNTGSILFSAGNGISISGFDIAMNGSYSGNFSASGSITSNNAFISSVDTTSNFSNIQINNSAGAYSNWDIGISNVGSSEANENSLYFYNSDSAITALNLYPNGEVMTLHNTLDNGSGGLFTNGGIAINTTISTTASTYINYLAYNINNTTRFYNQVYAASGENVNENSDYWFVGWGANGDQLLQVYGSGAVNTYGSLYVSGYVSAYNSQILMFTGGTAVNGNSGQGGISIEGRPRIGDWGEWLTIGEPNGTNGGNVIQITGSGIFTGYSSGITNSVSVRNTLDNGSGSMTVSENLSVNGGINVPYPPQQYTATGTFNTSEISYSEWSIMVVLGSYNIGTSSQTISSVGISATVQEYNNGGSTNIAILVTNNSLSVSDTISPSSTNILGYFTLTGGDSSTSTMYTTNGVISGLSNSSTIYLYVACGNTGYTHTVSFSNVWVR